MLSFSRLESITHGEWVEVFYDLRRIFHRAPGVFESFKSKRIMSTWVEQCLQTNYRKPNYMEIDESRVVPVLLEIGDKGRNLLLVTHRSAYPGKWEKAG